jgi:hypothetical protein
MKFHKPPRYLHRPVCLGAVGLVNVPFSPVRLPIPGKDDLDCATRLYYIFIILPSSENASRTHRHVERPSVAPCRNRKKKGSAVQLLIKTIARP